MAKTFAMVVDHVKEMTANMMNIDCLSICTSCCLYCDRNICSFFSQNLKCSFNCVIRVYTETRLSTLICEISVQSEIL